MLLLLRFARRYMVPFLPWFAAGALALLVTNWLSVTIPLFLAHAIDALRLEPARTDLVMWDAAIIAGSEVRSCRVSERPAIAQGRRVQDLALCRGTSPGPSALPSFG